MSKSNETTPNVPTLRFPNYSGEWQVSSMGKVCTFRKGYGISKENLSSDGTPCVLYGELYTTYKTAIAKRIKSKTSLDPTTLFHSKKNDVIIPCSGETAEDIATSVCIPYDDILLGGDLTVIRSDLDGAFLSNQINSVRKYDIARIAQGKSIVHLQADELKKISIAYPTIDEQQKISGFIDKIDERIEVQNKIISDLKVLKKELCRKMLSSIAEYKPLGELCSITTGKLDANANNQNGLYPFFTCGKDTLSIDNYAFDGEAILIAGNGDIGHTKYYYGKFNAYQRTYVLMGFKADAQFVKMGIDTYLPQKISEETQGGAMPYIKLSTLTSLKIPFTTEEKQLSIRNHYDTIAQKVENETKMLDLLLQQKSYFLNAMFI